MLSITIRRTNPNVVFFFSAKFGAVSLPPFPTNGFFFLAESEDSFPSSRDDGMFFRSVATPFFLSA